MKKYLLFRNLTKRVIVPLVLSITLLVTGGKSTINEQGTECSVCGEENDVDDITGSHPKPTGGGG
ncbi:MAG: hypothetical protein HFG79_13555 [Lachnospiraceae bacterium]|nr:hypothetical protein [Lachnospiraceae bacterium]